MHWSSLSPQSTDWADISRCLGLGSLNAVKFSLLSSLSPRINVFCISGHLSGSLSFLASDWSEPPSPGFWLADTGHLLRWGLCSSTTCLIVDMTQINWPVTKLARAVKWKSERESQHPHRIILPSSVCPCRIAHPHDHTLITQRGRNRSDVLSCGYHPVS